MQANYQTNHGKPVADMKIAVNHARKISNKIVPEMNTSARWLLQYLLTWQGKNIFISNERLAKETKLTRSTLGNSLAILKKAKLIDREPIHNKKTWSILLKKQKIIDTILKSAAADQHEYQAVSEFYGNYDPCGINTSNRTKDKQKTV